MACSTRYSLETITDADYVDNQTVLANAPDQAESLLYSLEQAERGIGLYMNSFKTASVF